MTLLMATVDKFYAVMFPFKYGSKRTIFLKVAAVLSTVVNAMLTVSVEAAITFTDRHGYAFDFMVTGYNTMIGLTFLTTNILYVIIVAKLFYSQRKTRSVTPKDAG